MVQIQEKAEKYIKADETMKKQPLSYEDKGSKERKGNQDYEPKEKYPRKDKGSDSPKKIGRRFEEYTRLNAPRSQILLDIEKDTDVRWPKPLRTDPEKRDKNLFCKFHKDIGHDTDDCRQLKDDIEFLIRRGRLNRYTKNLGGMKTGKGVTTGEIKMIEERIHSLGGWSST